MVKDIGYTAGELCFDGHSCAVLTAVHAQSPDIAMGVDNAWETRGGEVASGGAGDQGMMFGFACSETPELMPLPISLAHGLTRRLAQVRKDGILPWLRPDGKSQVTVVYEDGKPVAVDTVVISTQHDEQVSQTEIERQVLEQVIRQVIPESLWTEQTKIFVNPTAPLCAWGACRRYGAHRAARSSWTPTADMPTMVAVLFPRKESHKVDRSPATAPGTGQKHCCRRAGRAL